MFIKSVYLDEYLNAREYPSEDVSENLIRDLIRSLDGERRTMVGLYSGQDEGHMAIAGDASAGLIVYMTENNMEFFNLKTRAVRAEGNVSLIAAGQPGDYDSRHVVTLDEALRAATFYAETGDRASDLLWEAKG